MILTKLEQNTLLKSSTIVPETTQANYPATAALIGCYQLQGLRNLYHLAAHYHRRHYGYLLTTLMVRVELSTRSVCLSVSVSRQ